MTKNSAKNGPGAIPEPTDSPDEPKALQKVAERAHRRRRQAKENQKDDTGTPKKRQRLQKTPKDFQRLPKRHPKYKRNATKRVSASVKLYYTKTELPCR